MRRASLRCLLPCLLLCALSEGLKLRPPVQLRTPSPRPKSAVSQQLAASLGPMVAAALISFAPLNVALAEVADDAQAARTAARTEIARAASARAADAQKALESGLSFAGKSLASAAQTAKEIATAEETMLALETMRKAAIEAAEAAKELAAAEETKQALDSARRATLKTLEVASTKAQRVISLEPVHFR